MEEILKKIVEIEKEAQQIISSARDLENNLDESISHEKRKMYDTLMKKAENRLIIVQENEEKYLNDSISKIKIENKEQFDKLLNNFKKNNEQWINAMFNNIIEG